MTKETFTVKLSEIASHCIKQIADNDFRTPERLIEILIYKGMQFQQHDQELVVRKMEEHKDPEKGPYQYYTNEEIVEFFKPEIK